MKKTFIYTASLAGVLATTGSVNAQKLYSGVNFHYGFGVCPMEGESSNYSNMSDIVTYESKSVSLGEGLTSGIYAGYLIKHNIGLELGVNYLYGSKNVLYKETETDFEYLEEDIYTISANSLRLIPTVRIKFGEKKLSTYIKTGLIFGVGTKAILNEEYKEMSIGPSYEATYQIEFTGGLSLGFHSAIGLNYTFGK
ncbi:MAG TPA: hypothetical protein VK177_18865, partial [Flavobacteriales bacterium]|nr:hypothetical protein [Flavobacteriales bacterium]